MIDVFGKYQCPNCGVRNRVIKVKFDKRTKNRVNHQKRGFFWKLICPFDGSEVQEVKEEPKKILPKVHFGCGSFVVLSMDETKFIDCGLKEAKMRKKYPLHKIIDGSSANKMMGLDDRGYPI
jgi:hypothetical protein